jgi:hypothetical protein
VLGGGQIGTLARFYRLARREFWMGSSFCLSIVAWDRRGVWRWDYDTILSFISCRASPMLR